MYSVMMGPMRAFISRLSYIQWTCIVVHSCVIAFLSWFIFLDPDNRMVWEWGPSKNLRVLGQPIDTWYTYSLLVIVVAVTRCTEDIVLSMMSADLNKGEYVDLKQNPVEAYKQGRLRIAYYFIVATTLLKSVVILSRVDLALISMLLSVFSVWLTGAYFSREDHDSSVDTSVPIKDGAPHQVLPGDP